MSGTRGPAPGKVPPHVADRLEQKRRKAAERAARGPVWQRPLFVAAAAVVVALVGVGIGLALAGDPQAAVADEIEEEVVPLANRAEAIWRVGIDDAPAIADAASALESANETADIEEHLQTWIDAHQEILDEIDTVEVRPLGWALRDHFGAFVRAQLDGVVLLGAAAAHDGSARQELLRAAVRAFTRARTLLSQSRATLAEIGGPELPVVQVPVAPGLTQPGQPLPSPFGEAPDPLATPDAPPGTPASPAPSPSPQDTTSPTAEPTPTASPS